MCRNAASIIHPYKNTIFVAISCLSLAGILIIILLAIPFLYLRAWWIFYLDVLRLIRQEQGVHQVSPLCLVQECPAILAKQCPAILAKQCPTYPAGRCPASMVEQVAMLVSQALLEPAVTKVPAMDSQPPPQNIEIEGLVRLYIGPLVLL